MAHSNVVFGAVLGALALATTAGCAGRTAVAVRPAPYPTIDVTNMSAKAVQVFVFRSGMRVPVGVVSWAETRRFVLNRPIEMGDGLKFEVVPLGDRAGYLTESVFVGEGHRFALNVSSRLDRSELKQLP